MQKFNVMEALIQVSTNEQGSSVVSARELHSYLEIKSEFPKWCKRMFDYGFIQGKDYIEVVAKNDDNLNGGRKTLIDYALTIETSKEISMIQRSEKGKKAREYFLDCEKIAKQKVVPANNLDFMQLQLNQMRENDVRITALEEKVKTIALLGSAAQLITDEFTIVGFTTLNKIKCNIQLACQLGKFSKAEARRNNIELQTIVDPRFGKVNIYPKNILKKIFREQKLIQKYFLN